MRRGLRGQAARFKQKSEMQLANVIEERGQFWWFGEERQTSSLEQSVHGLLTVSEEGQIITAGGPSVGSKSPM